MWTYVYTVFVGLVILKWNQVVNIKYNIAFDELVTGTRIEIEILFQHSINP
jgi:hypothetical protein